MKIILTNLIKLWGRGDQVLLYKYMLFKSFKHVNSFFPNQQTAIASCSAECCHSSCIEWGEDFQPSNLMITMGGILGVIISITLSFPGCPSIWNWQVLPVCVAPFLQSDKKIGPNNKPIPRRIIWYSHTIKRLWHPTQDPVKGAYIILGEGEHPFLVGSWDHPKVW